MPEPRAIVHFINDQVVLEDPDGLAMLRVVAKHNCEVVFKAQSDRVAHFKQRMADRGDDPKQVMIVLINVDDCVLARELAETLMPGHDWQPYRDAGAIPYARGLCTREGIQYVLEEADFQAAAKLSEIDGIACAVFDHKTVEVFHV